MEEIMSDARKVLPSYQRFLHTRELDVCIQFCVHFTSIVYCPVMTPCMFADD